MEGLRYDLRRGAEIMRRRLRPLVGLLNNPKLPPVISVGNFTFVPA
ncbi:MAG: hypothetical protein ACI9XK_002630, partial [Granulosicoccus sp.]